MITILLVFSLIYLVYVFRNAQIRPGLEIGVDLYAIGTNIYRALRTAVKVAYAVLIQTALSFQKTVISKVSKGNDK